jgi:flagellar hook-basal body protein
MSFYTSLTGLNAATSQLAVTSNNIANVGTTGFKRSRADFGDIFATSPLQKASSVIGQGVALKQVTQEFSQGNISASNNSLDIAITGDGFFPLKSADGLQNVFTRNGTFMLNDSYNVVNSSGQALIAAAVDSSGKADLGNLSKLLIPVKTSGDASATTAIDLGLNLPSDATVPLLPFNKNDPTTYNKTTAVTVYDSGGNDYLATVYYRKTQVATTADPSNKWQTYVYIGDTKLSEKLIQSTDSNNGNLYVNKYGQIKTEADIPPQDITRGVTKLFSMDDLKSPVQSSAASVSGSSLSPSLVTDWKNGITFPDKVTSINAGKVSGAVTYATTAGDTNFVFDDGSKTYMATTLGALQLAISGDDSSHNYTVAISGNNLIATGNAGQNFTLPALTSVPTAPLTSPSSSAISFTNTSATAAFSFNDGTTTYTGTSLADLKSAISADDASHHYKVSVSDTNLTVTPNSAQTFTLPTLTADAASVSAGLVATHSAPAAPTQNIKFTLNVDGSTNPISVDLSALGSMASGTSISGVEMATKITNAIDKAYGSQRYFDFSARATGTPAQADLFKVSLDSGTPATITLTAGSNGITNLSQVTVEQATAAVQAQVTAKGLNVTVDYDPVAQSFTFKPADSAKHSIELTSANGTSDELFGLSAIPVTADGSTGNYGKNVIPNGLPIVDVGNQRYGTTVTFDETKGTFNIASGTTGDTSSVTISNASSLANALFGFTTSPTGIATATSTTPVRGIVSAPAVLTGGTIGINLDNKFRVDSTNNQFVVTVDNVTGLVTIPPKSDYTTEQFRTELENRINALADSFGSTVSGVKVEVDTAPGTNNKFFKITTGTSGDASFLKVSANSIWGMANLASVRGTTSTWQQPPQTKSTDGFPLYVDRNGNETSDPGNFSEAQTQNLWSPIFLTKGELTFDTAGTLKSPVTATGFNSTSIGSSGAALQFSINYGSSTQYSSPFSVLKQDQNGRPEGDLIGVDIADNGLVSASYSNGTQKSLAKIVLANFASPTGLRQIGDSSYYSTSKSGVANYGEAGAAGFGTVKAGATEHSNVDLTSELVDLITAQRNFQANAKAIETDNTLTTAIINIRA